MEGELISRAALEIVSQGPLPLSELAARLIAQGLLEEDYDEDELVESLGDEVWLDSQDIAYLVAPLIEGRCFTHRLSAEELEQGRLKQFPDFAGLWLPSEGDPLAAYANLFTQMDEDWSQWVYAIDPDWLTSFAPGDLISLTKRGSEVIVSACADPGEGEAERRALGELHARFVAEKVVCDAEDFILHLLAREPDLFRSPGPTLGEHFIACRIPVNGAYIDGLDAGFDNYLLYLLAELWGMERCCLAELVALKSTFAAWQVPELRGGVDVAEAARHLAHSVVATAFVDLYGESEMGHRPAFREFAEALSTVRGPRAAAGMYLMGWIHDIAGDPEQARASFARAHLRDPGYEPAIDALAALAADSGDAAEARSLYGRSGSPEAREEAEWLDEALGAEMPKVGRNEPCPCGSGRKYKACHEGMRAQMSPAKRHEWLLRRISFFPERPGHRMRFFNEMAHLGSIYDFDEELDDDALVTDLLAWDDDSLAQYHARRSAILAREDAEVVAALAESKRDLWEVISVEPGRWFRLRNVRTWQEVHLAEKNASEGASVGDYMLARVAFTPGGPGLYGVVIPVPLSQRDEVLAMLDEHMDSFDLAEWHAARIAAPVGALFNTSGEALVACSVSARLPDPSAAAAILDRHYERDGDGAWLSLQDTQGMEDAIVATLRIEGDILTFGANSLERFAVVSNKVQELLGSLEIVAQEFMPIADAMGALAPRGVSEMPEPHSAKDPDLEAALAAFVRDAEVKWLDEEIPALRGRTPRQAADDPTLREDLDRLLTEFERNEARAPEGSAVFSTARLREMLGL